jgi:hypothetical protein
MDLVTSRRGGAVLALAVTLQACATLDGHARAARSPAACTRAAVTGVEAASGGDKRAHCLGAARIAQRCSVAEAMLAAYAKELRDLFGRGDAELADLRAGRAGIGCARAGPDAAEPPVCCEARGY